MRYCRNILYTRADPNDGMAYANCMLDNKVTDTRVEYVIPTAFPRNNGYTNASHCYVIRTLPIL
jgi:hypothetical protein